MNKYKRSVSAALIFLLFGAVAYRTWGLKGYQAAPLLKNDFDSSLLVIDENVKDSPEEVVKPEKVKLPVDSNDNSLISKANDEDKKVEEAYKKWKESKTLPNIEEGKLSKYPEGSFGYIWSDVLLSTDNVDWWKEHGKKFKNIKYTNYIYSHDFGKLHVDLKDETDEQVIAQKLRDMCEKYYLEQDKSKHGERQDIWVYCRKELKYEY